MEYVYAAAILHELDREINEVNMTAVLEAAGADVSESRVKALIAALEDVDLDQAAAEADPEELAPGASGAVPAAQTEEPVEEADETLPDTTDEDEVEEDEDDSSGLSDMFSS